MFDSIVYILLIKLVNLRKGKCSFGGTEVQLNDGCQTKFTLYWLQLNLRG